MLLQRDGVHYTVIALNTRKYAVKMAKANADSAAANVNTNSANNSPDMSSTIREENTKYKLMPKNISSMQIIDRRKWL
jgi:hypothetical protein